MKELIEKYLNEKKSSRGKYKCKECGKTFKKPVQVGAEGDPGWLISPCCHNGKFEKIEESFDEGKVPKVKFTGPQPLRSNASIEGALALIEEIIKDCENAHKTGGALGVISTYSRADKIKTILNNLKK
jgi:hypothetical protein